MSELNCVIINSILYAFLFACLLFRYKWYNLSTLLSGIYLINSVFSLLLYISPFYAVTVSAAGTITIEPFLYMFSWYFLLIMSFSHINLNEVRYVTNYHQKYLYNIQLFLCVILTIQLLFLFPQSIMDFFSGRDLGMLRDATYGFSDSHKGLFIINIIGRLFDSTPILLLVISSVNILLFDSKKSIDRYSLCIYLLFKMNTIFAMISRATIIFSFFEILVAIFFFHKYVVNKMKMKVIVGSILAILLVVPIFSNITRSRFDESNTSEYFDISTLRYMGESQLNFNALEYPDLVTPMYGYSQFSLFRRLMGLNYNDGKGRDGSDVTNSSIEKKFKYKHPVYVFYGLAGGWYFNWGRIGSFVLVSLFFFFMKKNKVKIKISFSVIMITIIMASYSAKGMFFCDYGFESGNMLIIYVLLLSRLLKRYGYSKRVKCI